MVVANAFSLGNNRVREGRSPIRKDQRLMRRFITIRHCLISSFLLLIVSLTSSCFAQEQSTTSAASTAPLNLETQLTQISSATIEFAEHRTTNAQATIVFENGLLLDLSTWKAVAAGLNPCCNLFFYNRPGVGRSTRQDTDISPESESMRLRHALEQRGLNGPYILVGHSLGGQYAQAFAMRYPDQVDGLILVDALPLGVSKAYSEFPWYTRLGLWIFMKKTARQEIANIEPMGRYVMERASLYNKPMIRIVAQSTTQQQKPQGLVKDLLRGVIYAEDFGVWQIDPAVAEERMNKFYPNAEVKSLPANHRIQEQYPELVIEAISNVIKQATSPTLSSTKELLQQPEK
ncbi:MAG: alpha/beta hydrolase [Burkholderiaceae bacterium]|nr:MAG: alpha/beta hydrolase [Burkholderiaceae bacterium]